MSFVLIKDRICRDSNLAPSTCGVDGRRVSKPPAVGMQDAIFEQIVLILSIRVPCGPAKVTSTIYQ